jgi:type II secretion system protein D
MVISVDARTNSLVVSTSPRSFELLHGLLETLDKEESRYAVGLHVVYVPQGDVRQLAPKLQRLMRDRIDATRRAGDVESPEDVFTIEAEPATSSLIVAASDENLVLLRDFIDMLTKGGLEATSADRLEVISLTTLGRATEIAAAVNSLYVQRENERRGERAVTVVASERQNALIVMGNEADVNAVRGIVSRLDRTQVENVVDYKRIVLNSASAREVVTLIQDALAGRSIRGGSGGSQQATILRVFKDQVEGSVAEATIDGNIRDQITLTPDSRTNSIMVTAPTEVMSLITQIIEDLDLDRRGDRVIEAFELLNADAQAMAVLLGELFNLRQLGDSLVLIPSRAGDETDESSGRFTPVPDVRQELSITVDRRTNTLLVSGTREYLDEVKEVVERLDAIQALEREQRVFNLRNAQAAEIQSTLQSYFESEAERRRLTLGPQRAESFIRQLEQEVTVVGDEKSNKLVISASPRYIEAVSKIVQELDASPPQVMIQVLLAEITLDNADTWGMDINIGGLVATSKIGGDGYVFESLAGGAGVATSLGVPNFSVASTDFTLLLRALEEQGRLEVLSRPHVTVNNNEDALIQVGEDIAIVTGVQRDNFTGGTTANVERRDVGIILNVRPSISSDGFVRMNIAPEISQLSARTVQIDSNFNAPIITQRLVDTVVTVKNGQTVVIGGLIQTIEDNRKTKIRGLGNLPIVGGLFRTSDNSKVKTELLVILTPYVIPGDSPAAELTQRQISTDKIFGLDAPAPVLKALGHEDGLPAVSGPDGAVQYPRTIDPQRAEEWSEWFNWDEDNKE